MSEAALNFLLISGVLGLWNRILLTLWVLPRLWVRICGTPMTLVKPFSLSHRLIASRSAAIAIVVFVSFASFAQGQAQSSSGGETQHATSLSNQARSSASPGLYDPVADTRATVKVGNARFTILTPQLIRMEWSADGKVEDHASLVFLNRHLAVPKFTSSTTNGGSTHILKTDALTLEYTLAQDGGGMDLGGLGLPLEGHTWQAKNNWGYRSFETREALNAALSRRP